MVNRVFNLQRDLSALALPSGFEHRVSAYIKDIVTPLCDEVWLDRMGNLICHKKGEGKKLMACAHMDVIGFMATFIEKEGYIRLSSVGYHTPAALVNARIVFESGARGVIRPGHKALLAGSTGSVKLSELFCDIGAKDKEEALSKVQIGDVAVFESRTELIKNGRIMTNYADDLVGCIALILALEQLKEHKNDLYFVFTTQEEVGLKGARASSYGIAPDGCIAIDVCDGGDSLESPEHRRIAVRLGQGPAIKLKDAGMISDRPMIDHLKRAAKGVPHQLEIMLMGSTDAASVQRVHGGVLSSGLSIPTRNIHSGAEVYDAQDVIDTAKVLANALQKEF